MHGRRGIANQVYIPPVDYDNNIKELKSPRRQLPRQYSDPPPYHENGTNGSVDSNYMQQQGANIFEMQSQSNGTITSTNSSYCSYDSLKNEEGSYSYIPFPENEARRVLKPDTRKVTHRYVIIVAIVLVALAILAAIAATALIITETSSCGEETCPPPGVWGTWSEWSDCSKTCGEGVSTRTRTCDNSAGGECIAVDTETKTCQDRKCWDPWGEWSGCILTCGNGIRSRNRTCDGKYTGEECGWDPPTFKDTKTCTNSVTCQEGFCESRSANCSYNHPSRCDMYITCDAGKNMHEQVCNVLMWYKVRDTNPCLGYCDWEANVQCTQ